jgi:hypothetical protein
MVIQDSKLHSAEQQDDFMPDEIVIILFHGHIPAYRWTD